MKLSISNIAWDAAEEEQVARLLEAEGVRYVEVVPAKIGERVESYRRFWDDRGIRIVAMQALLFGRPDLRIFGDAAKRREMIEFLAATIDLGARLGAETLVFGAPNSRRVDATSRDEVRRIEEQFFGEIGRRAEAAGVRFCVEAVTGCDSLRTMEEIRDLMLRVGSAGLGLHVDTAALQAAGESIDDLDLPLQHVHASEPELAPIGSGGVPHANIAGALRRKGYERWVSIEMLPPPGGRAALVDAIRFAREIYFGTTVVKPQL